MNYEDEFNTTTFGPLKPVRSRICEGQKVPHAHTDVVREYRYLMNKLIDNIITANLCSRCVHFDRDRGYILERTFTEENTGKVQLSVVKSKA